MCVYIYTFIELLSRACVCKERTFFNVIGCGLFGAYTRWNNFYSMIHIDDTFWSVQDLYVDQFAWNWNRYFINVLFANCKPRNFIRYGLNWVNSYFPFEFSRHMRTGFYCSSKLNILITYNSIEKGESTYYSTVKKNKKFYLRR